MIDNSSWDVVVVGAGPGGAVAARELAGQGASVLLVDRAVFPRAKVCGCCLNPAAQAALRSVGLGRLAAELGAVPLDRVRLAAGAREACIRFRAVALSRESMDTALAQAAVAAGAVLHQGVRAVLGPVERDRRTIQLHGEGGSATVSARVVIAANGLAGRLDPSDPAFDSRPVPGSRIGVGCVIPAENAAAFYEPGQVFMATARGGYLGLVRLEDGRLDLAGCLDAAFLREAGSPANAARFILRSAGWPCPDGLDDASWKGTPPLTRRPRAIAGTRWFAIGDAAGYVEPFTGEGMAWAIQSAVAVAPLAISAMKSWDDSLLSAWPRLHARLFHGHQRLCRGIAKVLRSEWAARSMVRVLSNVPGLSRPIVVALNRPVRSFRGVRV